MFEEVPVSRCAYQSRKVLIQQYLQNDCWIAFWILIPSFCGLVCSDRLAESCNWVEAFLPTFFDLEKSRREWKREY